MRGFSRLARDEIVTTRLLNRRGFGGGYVPNYVPKTLVLGLVARFGLGATVKIPLLNRIIK